MPNPVKSSDPVHNQVLLSVRQLGKNRKREHFPAGLLRLGQLAFAVTEVSKSRLQVDAKGVINLDQQVQLLGERQDRAEVRRQSKKVNRHDGAGFGCVDVKGSRIDIDKTGLVPARAMEPAVAIKLNEELMTSSPRPTPAAIRVRIRASVPEAQPTVYAALNFVANSRSKSATRPEDKLLAFQYAC